MERLNTDTDGKQKEAAAAAATKLEGAKSRPHLAAPSHPQAQVLDNLQGVNLALPSLLSASDDEDAHDHETTRRSLSPEPQVTSDDPSTHRASKDKGNIVWQIQPVSQVARHSRAAQEC
jgi:hypothetical protein